MWFILLDKKNLTLFTELVLEANSNLIIKIIFGSVKLFGSCFLITGGSAYYFELFPTIENDLSWTSQEHAPPRWLYRTLQPFPQSHIYYELCQVRA